MRQVVKFIMVLITGFAAVSCNNNNIKEKETNAILRKLINESRDSTARYFQKVDSAGHEKIKMVTHPKKPDSVAIFYKSVDSLRFKIPVTRRNLHHYLLISHKRNITQISDSVIDQWNTEIYSYKQQKWSKKEKKDLPVFKRKPSYLSGYFKHRQKHRELQEILYFSIPFFNKNNTKALIYRYKYSSNGIDGQLYIMSKNNNTWQIIYRGTTFVSTF